MNNNHFKSQHQQFNRILLTVGLTVSLVVAASAAPGDLDPTFGNGGIVVTPLETIITDYLVAKDLHTQPDGKIIVSGGSYSRSFIARYNQNGTLDTSFGTNGIISIQHDYIFEPQSSALQPDGKIVTGASNTNYMLTRYNADGTLDVTFGMNGRVITPIGFGGRLSDLIVQPDGKIIAAGNINYEFAIVRYNSNGSLDTAFGTDGKLLIYVSNLGQLGTSVLLQPDGKIVLGGYTDPDIIVNGNFALVRSSPNGTLDSIFVTDISGYSDRLHDLALQGDGKIIAAGLVGLSDTTTGIEGSAFVRYNTDGSPDDSFAANGILRLPPWSSSNYFGGDSIAVQSNGKILATGIGNNNLAVMRFNTNGSPDVTFGTNGRVITPNVGRGDEIALQPDGKILVAGGVQGGIAIVRYLGDSTAQRARQFDFDGDGKSDIAVFRPSNGTWYLQQSQSGFAGIAFGQTGDKITPADYDGDGKTDIAVYRGGTWYLQRSSAGFIGIAFGAPDDIPIPADFDGDGRAELAIYRPSNGTWYFYNLATNQTSSNAFSVSEDKPVPADYDGDGKTDVAVFRPSDGVWYLQRSQLGYTEIQFGEGTDKPVAADYDGDGRADIAVFRPSNGVWYLQRSMAGLASIAFGFGTDTPTPADYDGDGKADIAVFRNGVWYLQQSTSGFAGVTFGASSDVPVEAAYVP